MKSLVEIPEIKNMLNAIEDVQEGQDLSCSCTTCYWNMYREDSKLWSTERSKVCVSESLSTFKMKPNTEKCPGYWER